LEEIEAGHIPVLTVLNKIDLLSDPAVARRAVENFPNAVAISARTGEGLPDLLGSIQRILYETYQSITVRLPYQEGQLISLFHEFGQVERIELERGGVRMQGRIPGRLAAQFAPWRYVPAENVTEQDDLEEEV
jgi:GTP-binding protein HflX